MSHFKHLIISLVLVVPCMAMAMTQDQNGEFYYNNHHVKRHNVDIFLRNLSPEQLKKFNPAGNRVRATQLDDGDYYLRPLGDIKGGGPWLATAIAIVGYPAVGVAAIAATISSIPVAGPGCIAVGWGVAATGTVAVTKGVVVAAVAPTP